MPSGGRSCSATPTIRCCSGCEIEPVASQFPSTTTAHLTTLSTGLPVEQHGLYEWRCYEPSLGVVIRPLLFAPSATRTRR